MTSRPSMKQQGGYILMYVIAIVIFLSVIGLGTAQSLRRHAREVLDDKERVRRELLLDSALQYTLAQLVRTKALEPQVKAKPDSAAALALWKAGEGPYSVEIQGETVAVDLQEGGELPDINVLTNEAIERIFRHLGAAESEAKAFAEAIKKGKEAAGGTFRTLEQLLSLEAIPYKYRYGAEPVKDEQGETQPEPALKDLVSVGTGLKTADINRAPIVVIAAVSDTANVEVLHKFQSVREKKRLSLPEALDILKPKDSGALRDGASGIYRITASLDGYQATALAKYDQPPPKLLGVEVQKRGSAAPSPHPPLTGGMSGGKGNLPM